MTTKIYSFVAFFLLLTMESVSILFSQTTHPSQITNNRSLVLVSNATWFDASRNRNIPVKIYFPSERKEKCPVIIFSHGLGGSNEKCAYLGQSWAANDFISVHIQHHGLDEDVWKGKIRPIKGLRDVYDQHWSGRLQANDIRFVLTQLDLFAKSDSSFGKMLDMSHVGAAGYDLGGLASMLVAGQIPPDGGFHLHDTRIKAIIVMSPPVFTSPALASQVYSTMKTPALFFTGTNDNGIIGTTQSWQRRIPFDFMLDADRFLITYQDADHLIYAGHDIRVTKTESDHKYQSNIAQASLLFWRAYLRNELAVQAYFQGPTLGGIAGTLGRVERRLVKSGQVTHTSYNKATAFDSNSVTIQSLKPHKSVQSN
ncbi:MAG: hypothetical protein LBJ67_16510 [Planctomycetaceae bacterium]|jgi:predicted dienelactone hydrolase|nr:hypothetical protein [Planctomycetaceae bacterium]